MKLTQHQKIIVIMAKNPGRFFYPYDFMKPELQHLFVGYKAGTRIAELAKDYPHIFESKKAGSFVIRRLKHESIKQWYNDLDIGLKRALRLNDLSPNFSNEEILEAQGLRLAD